MKAPTKWAATMRRRMVAGEEWRPIADELHRGKRCMLCGRALTDPVSVERGVGPDCMRSEPALAMKVMS